MNWIIRERQRHESNYNAGSKARADVESILICAGYKPLDINLTLDINPTLIKKIVLQFQRFFEWKKNIREICEGDVVIIQFPVRNHTIFMYHIVRSMIRRGVYVIGLVHDLESLRQSMSKNIKWLSRIRFRVEEISVLKYFTRIVAHNEAMKEKMVTLFGVPSENIKCINIFDYLDYSQADKQICTDKSVIAIAGNLDIRKSGYIYSLPNDINFNLYGANYDNTANPQSNVSYKGKVDPDRLPGIIEGGFGLVWDGPSPKTCDGVYGEYLTINNPHKASLYLAAGMPVIVWSQAAIARFVDENKCGILIDSLSDIKESIDLLSDEEYKKICLNVSKIGNKVRNGYYTNKAINDCISSISR